ncbi:protein adenylyltransferase SelO, mitochondrial-like isoform X1 [Rhopilema esculentum]|uniref:protein adenylyltransferase SelO, mitochondrial-like isoform X1 n=1 Tax=Rhopilema esculentum TaxID=499914 RepID=UPI0031E27CB3
MFHLLKVSRKYSFENALAQIGQRNKSGIELIKRLSIRTGSGSCLNSSGDTFCFASSATSRARVTGTRSRPSHVFGCQLSNQLRIATSFQKRYYFGIFPAITSIHLGSRTYCDSCTNRRFEKTQTMAEAHATRTVTLENLNFDNKAVKELPLDNSVDPRVRRPVPGACFTSVNQEPLENPETVAYSSDALSLLDIPEEEISKDDFAEYFSGSKILPGSSPAAHCYCGHQFGYFSGQLGDGAAMYLGEIVNHKGERWELQLKGSGPTPFSRQADGRKVLRSSVREFLCSEAMHYLGIPTTRSGSCVTSDTRVMRDIFYNGKPIMERATVISRIAPTFLRFGSFEIFKPLDQITGRKGPSVGDKELLHKMLKYSITTFFPETAERFPEAGPDQYGDFYKEVVIRTARLVAHWQAVGFCHGVLNTDNMSILGLTIDYGPFGFMDYYNPDHVCNASDDQGRYSYQNQPSICKWNLRKFAEALQDALPLDLSLEILNLYDDEYKMAYLSLMRKKLGLLRMMHESDSELISSLFETMEKTCADFTNTFRYLSNVKPAEADIESEERILMYLVSQCQTVEEMKKASQTNTEPGEIQLLLRMLQAQPTLLQQLGGGAVAQLKKELEKMEKGKELDNITQAEKSAKDKELWKEWLKEYRNRLQDEFKDQDDLATKDQAMMERVKTMNESNPRIVLRNYVAQHVIEAAEEGNYEEIRHLLKLLRSPFSEDHQTIDGFNIESSHSESSSDVSGQSNNVCKPPVTKLESLSKAIDYQSTIPSWAVDLRVT